MTAPQTDPEVVLYDLACTKNVCFSPVVWRIRLMLNYKRIPYRTVFLEFSDIEPTLKAFGVALPDRTASGDQPKYTVPAIHHLSTNTYTMDSTAIAQFLSSIYPDPPLPMTSELGRAIETATRRAVGPAFRTSLMPREISILSPPSQEYFRRTREAALGHPLEDLLNRPGGEEGVWSTVDADVRAAGELAETHKAEGPFVLGASLSYTDFVLVGSLQCARVIDEGVFQRIIAYPGFGRVYDACASYMEKKD